MEKGKAAEGHYWAMEDEKLLKKMVENNPELDPANSLLADLISGAAGDTTEDQVQLVLMKHGIPPANKVLIADLAALVAQGPPPTKK